jgi:hypothetical protein
VIWAEHIICIGKIKAAQKILVGNLTVRNALEDLDADDRIILKWITENQCEIVWTRLFWVTTRTSG